MFDTTSNVIVIFKYSDFLNKNDIVLLDICNDKIKLPHFIELPSESKCLSASAFALCFPRLLTYLSLMNLHVTPITKSLVDILSIEILFM